MDQKQHKNIRYFSVCIYFIIVQKRDIFAIVLTARHVVRLGITDLPNWRNVLRQTSDSLLVMFGNTSALLSVKLLLAFRLLLYALIYIPLGKNSEGQLLV